VSGLRDLIRLCCLGALVAVGARPARGDEFRLADGEILHALVEEEGASHLVVRGRDGVRRLPLAEVQERIAGGMPSAVLAREEAAATREGAWREALARRAWSLGLDEDVGRLARAEIVESPGSAWAHSFLGEVRGPGGFEAGFPVGAPGPGPRHGAARRKALPQGGVTVEHLRAADLALAWLAAHQEEDGRIDADGFPRHDPPQDRTDGEGGGHHGERVPCPFDGAVTAAALLAFQAAGSTPVSGPHREAVAKALAWARAQLSSPPRSGYDLWNHGWLVQAVADACAMTRDPALRDLLADSAAAILRLQRPDGGWSYVYDVGDVPTTAVALMALGETMRAGVPVRREPIDRALSFLDARVDARSGRSEYHAGAERKGYTPTTANAAAALAARARLGRLEDSRHLGKQVSAIQAQSPDWTYAEKEVKTRDGRVVKAQVGSLYPIRWYHATVAFAQRGGGTWSRWGPALRRALLSGQRQDGAARGSWDPLGPYSTSAGRAFVTALGALMLLAPLRVPAERP